MSKTIFIVIGIFILLSIFGTFFVNWLWIKLRKLKSTNNENYLKLKKCWFALVVLQISFIVILAIVTILKTVETIYIWQDFGFYKFAVN